MKTQETLKLEHEIWLATQKTGVYGCFEVTIGKLGNGRVDYLTYDTKGIWRCYEIKASLSDFRSKAEKSFVGHYNYFVLTSELANNPKVIDEIPDGIGCYSGGWNLFPATRRELAVDDSVLKNSLIRSLAREYQATRHSQDRERMKKLERELERAQKDYREEHHRYREIQQAVMKKYGHKALFDLFDD